jgi:hypothetical protein
VETFSMFRFFRVTVVTRVTTISRCTEAINGTFPRLDAIWICSISASTVSSSNEATGAAHRATVHSRILQARSNPKFQPLMCDRRVSRNRSR